MQNANNEELKDSIHLILINYEDNYFISGNFFSCICM